MAETGLAGAAQPAAGGALGHKLCFAGLEAAHKPGRDLSGLAVLFAGPGLHPGAHHTHPAQPTPGGIDKPRGLSLPADKSSMNSGGTYICDIVLDTLMNICRLIHYRTRPISAALQNAVQVHMTNLALTVLVVGRLVGL